MVFLIFGWDTIGSGKIWAFTGKKIVSVHFPWKKLYEGKWKVKKIEEILASREFVCHFWTLEGNNLKHGTVSTSDAGQNIVWPQANGSFHSFPVSERLFHVELPTFFLISRPEAINFNSKFWKRDEIIFCSKI